MTSAAPPEIAVLIGTRPEAIKLAPVIWSLRRASVRHVVLLTGQHREMLTQTLTDLTLVADATLDTLRPDQPLAQLSARLLEGTDDLLRQYQPRAVVIQGDTTSVAMAACPVV